MRAETTSIPAGHMARSAADVDSSSLPSDAGKRRRQSNRRWWLAVAAGTFLMLPFAWLLSFAAALPFFVGLFFFILFGLLIGAVAYRVAAAGRPYSRPAILLGTTIIVITGWTASIVKEAQDFPRDMATDAMRRAREIGGRSASEYRSAVEEGVRRLLIERYPPGATLGYVRWILTSGELKKGDIQLVEQTLRRLPCGRWWAVRAVLSVGLLGFGVGSQTFPLRATRARATDAGSIA